MHLHDNLPKPYNDCLENGVILGMVLEYDNKDIFFTLNHILWFNFPRLSAQPLDYNPFKIINTRPCLSSVLTKSVRGGL